jgi:hypothetical protein
MEQTYLFDKPVDTVESVQTVQTVQTIEPMELTNDANNSNSTELYDDNKCLELINQLLQNPTTNGLNNLLCTLDSNFSVSNHFLFERLSHVSHLKKMPELFNIILQHYTITKTFLQNNFRDTFTKIFRTMAVLGNTGMVQMMINFSRENAFDMSSVYNYVLCNTYGDQKFTIIKLILDECKSDPHSGINPGYNNDEPLKNAVIKGEVETVKLLLEFSKHDSRIDLTSNSNVLLKYAYQNGQFDIVKIFADHSKEDNRIDFSMNNHELYLDACNNGYILFVELFLELAKTDNRIDPAFNSNQALKTACEKRYTTMVAALLEHSKLNNNIDPGCNENYLLKYVCENNYLDVALLLLEHSKIDNRVNPLVNDGYCLNVACERGYNELANLLLSY